MGIGTQLNHEKWPGQGLVEVEDDDFDYIMKKIYKPSIIDQINHESVLIWKDFAKDMNRQAFGHPKRVVHIIDCTKRGIFSLPHHFDSVEVRPGHTCTECVDRPGFTYDEDDREWAECYYCHGRLFIPTRYVGTCTRCDTTIYKG